MQVLYIDSLTSTYNLRYYDEHFVGKEDTQDVAIIDVDNFKYINDNYGYGIGDIVLQSIAQAVLSYIREKDDVIR